MNSPNHRIDRRCLPYTVFTLLGFVLLIVLLDPSSENGSFSSRPVEEDLVVHEHREESRSQPGREDTDTRLPPLQGKDERRYNVSAKKGGSSAASDESSPRLGDHFSEKGEEDKQSREPPTSQKDQADMEDDSYDLGGSSPDDGGAKTDGEWKQKLPEIGVTAEKCDIYRSGRWVYDPETYPLYRSSQCPFISPQLSCQKNGRPDSDYERWRWEPSPSGVGCEIPRFNGTTMLEMLRGKRVVFAGDSLSANMWESLVCLLYTSVPDKRAEVRHKFFKAKDYNCRVEASVCPFLVDLDNKTLRLDKITPKSVKWRGADILVFNSGHWWTHTEGKFKAWNLIERDGEVVKEMDRDAAFERGMQTWAQWIDNNINSPKTTVFFRSISPMHFMESWCYNQTNLISDGTYVQRFPNSMVRIVETTINGMKTPVEYLNITRLSEYRRDGHPSLYRTRETKLQTEEHRSEADCSHWCLPGIPDTWNLLMYTSLLEKSKTTK